MKQFFIVIGICLIIGIAIIGYFIFPWALMSIGISTLPNPPKPTVTHGEFPFRLIYEIDGKQRTLEDKVICDYDGIGMDEGRGKYNKWKAHFSNGDEVTYWGIILSKDEEKTIYMYVGSPEFYMSMSEATDFKNTIRMKPIKGYADIVDEKDLWNKYHIRIIEWTHAQPIKNNLKAK